MQQVIHALAAMCSRRKEPNEKERKEYQALFRQIDYEGRGTVTERDVLLFEKRLDDASATLDNYNDDQHSVKLLDPARQTPVMDMDDFVLWHFKRQPRRPHICFVHCALILVQIIFGVGSVVGKLGVSKFNPVLFALIREASAGPLLLVMAIFLEGCVLKCCDRKNWRVIAGGFFLFMNQMCFIVGEKLSSAVIGSAWQPSQAIFTVALSLILCMEKPTLLKIGGILLASAGAVVMVVVGAEISSGINDIAGNVLFAINCLGTSLYVSRTVFILPDHFFLCVDGVF